MKYVIMLSCLLLSLYPVYSETAKITITGTVTDVKTSEPLIGVTIYFPDLKIGTTTNGQGNFEMENFPQVKTIVQISFVGYRTIVETLDLNRVTHFQYKMEEVATEMNEVVITGLSRATEQKRMPIPMSIVSTGELKQHLSTNVIDALSTLPGISQITTGSGISKPVIRGLGYNRVVTVQDEIRQEDQQWGDEHGVEIDENTVSKVEILKGPASLAYGSDAIAGVIHFISAPSLPENTIGGNAILNYQTNNGLFGYSANFAGNRSGLVWDLRYSNKTAHSYKNKYDGYVFNSGFAEHDFNGLLGIHKSWGYTHLSFNVVSLTPGIIEGERDSLTGKFVKITDNSQQIASASDLITYARFVPFQEINHVKTTLNSNIVIGGGNLKTTLGLQQNQRKEFGESTSEYGLYLVLNTFHYDVKYNFAEKGGWETTVGVNGMQQTSANKGNEFLIPDYHLFDFGIFGIVKKSLQNFDFSGGLRYDRRNQTGKDLYINSKGVKVDQPTIGDIQKFEGFSNRFEGLSGSLGATWQMSKMLFTKGNLSAGYRAPNIGELASNGVHEGTLRYEKGNFLLLPENSLQFDYTLGLNGVHVSAEGSVFYNSISHFIYLHKAGRAEGGDSLINKTPVFTYTQGNARLFGAEIRLDIHPHPLDWLHFENSFSFVNSQLNNQPDSSKYLPFTPPAKLETSLKAELPKWFKKLSSAYIKLDIENYFKQTHIFSANNTETITPAYTLIHAGLGFDIVLKQKTLCSFYINLGNVTNVAYQSHLSRLKYAPENYSTGRTGVYNMGRNIGFKLIVPLSISIK